MEYKHWVEVSQDLVDEITEERIIRDLISTLIRDIPIEELKYIFNVERRESDDFRRLDLYPTTEFLVMLESDMTREELEIKAELMKQLKYGNFK